MKLFTLLIIALIYSASAASGNLRSDRKSVAAEELRKLEGSMKVTQVTIDREVDGEGNVPKGRSVPYDANHPLTVPPEVEDNPDSDHGRRDLGYGASCSSCWWSAYYGYITYCCAYYGNAYSCDYYYC
jgi:hypothetical protein